MEWKQNCLKTFIGELCNQNKTSKLVSFDYGDMLQDVLNILYERTNLTVLRTFSMFECASRLKRELNGINSLIRQEK